MLNQDRVQGQLIDVVCTLAMHCTRSEIESQTVIVTDVCVQLVNQGPHVGLVTHSTYPCSWPV